MDNEYYRKLKRRGQLGESLGLVGMVLLAALFFGAIMARGACVSPDGAVSSARAMGFEDIEVTEHAWFAVGLRGCGTSDAARFTLRGTNPRGSRVNLVVCSGWLLKGDTVRGVE